MDITQAGIVMSFGALMAAAGLALLFFRREQGENRIKLFGWEFQISTPALVVFLVGCFIFILPVVTQMQSQPLFTIPLGHRLDGNHQVTTGNQQITTAKLVSIGTTIKGLIATKDQRDFFRFRSGQGLKTRVILRKISPGGFVGVVSIYDNNENSVDSSSSCCEDPISLAFRSNPGSEYYVKVAGDPGGPYELLIREE
jgi:hypothetical protein